MINLYAAEPEVFACCQPVHVITQTGPADEALVPFAFGLCKVGGLRDFFQHGMTLDHSNLISGSAHHLGIIGGGGARPSVMRITNGVSPKGLRCLDTDEPVAIHDIAKLFPCLRPNLC